MIVQGYMQQAMEKKVTKMVKEKGKPFLNANKSKEGVKVTASGLQYQVISSETEKLLQLLITLLFIIPVSWLMEPYLIVLSSAMNPLLLELGR